MSNTFEMSLFLDKAILTTSFYFVSSYRKYWTYTLISDNLMDQARILKLCRNESMSVSFDKLISLFPPIFYEITSITCLTYKLSTEGIDKSRINKWKIVRALCHLSSCLLAYLCTQCYQFTFLYRFEIIYLT